MPRTTLDIDHGVLAELKRRREREHKSLGALISELLAQALAEEEEATPDPFAWHTQPMGAKIDIEDKDALHAVLEER